MAPTNDIPDPLLTLTNLLIVQAMLSYPCFYVNTDPKIPPWWGQDPFSFNNPNNATYQVVNKTAVW